VKQLYEIAGLCPDEAVRDREEIKAEKLCARGTGRSLKAIERNGRKKKTGALGTSWWSKFTVLVERGLKERKHESFRHQLPYIQAAASDAIYSS
jgi:hypothetical protein